MYVVMRMKYVFPYLSTCVLVRPRAFWCALWVKKLSTSVLVRFLRAFWYAFEDVHVRFGTLFTCVLVHIPIVVPIIL